MYVQFFFESGYSTTVPYDDVIHIKYHYSVSEFMGGDWNGQPDHGPLLDTLNLNDQMLKGIAKAMNASYAINGVIKYNTLLDQGKTEKALQELTEHLQNSESGFLPIDLKAEFVPLKRDTKLIDADTLKFMDEKILRNWGVPLAILRGDYNKVQYAAFYDLTGLHEENVHKAGKVIREQDPVIPEGPCLYDGRPDDRDGHASSQHRRNLRKRKARSIRPASASGTGRQALYVA